MDREKKKTSNSKENNWRSSWLSQRILFGCSQNQLKIEKKEEKNAERAKQKKNQNSNQLRTFEMFNNDTR